MKNLKINLKRKIMGRSVCKGDVSMKRKFLMLNILLILVLTLGCTSNSNGDSSSTKNDGKAVTNKSPVTKEKSNKAKVKTSVSKEKKKELNLRSYYPIKENTKHIYKGTGNEFASFNVQTLYTKENKVQNRFDNGGTVAMEVIEVKDDAVTKLISREEVYYRENFLSDSVLKSRDKKKDEILLKAPLKKGNTWTLNDGRKRTITNISSNVKTPLKTYKAIEVTTQGKGKDKTMEYYAKDVGLIKTVFLSDGMEVKSELQTIEENTKFTQSIKFYYGYYDDNTQEYKIKYKENDVDFKTNDITRKVLENAYKDTLKGIGESVLTKNTKINYLYLNKDGMVYIDLSKDFIKELNLGSGYEAVALDALAATFGNYYGATKVVLTIDGGDYESGHIVLGKGDYLKVKPEGVPNSEVPVPDVPKPNVSAYYPIKENTKRIYQGSGIEYSSFNVYAAYTNKNRIQNRVDNGGTVLAEIIEVKDDSITQILSRGEIYYRENLLSDKILNARDKKKDEILLKAPLKKGNTWTLNDGSKRTITNISADVKTPLKTYKAIEVTTQGKGKDKTIEYYAENVGLVKTVFISDGMEVKSELKAIEENATLTQNIKFFYPNIDSTKLYYKEKSVDFKTNDITRQTLQKVYKDILKDTGTTVLTKNTKINYLYLNRDGMVYIDLSKDFLKEMNAGSSYEGMILQSIAATFGDYYGANKVVLTIDGGDYESGHIVLGKGDYLEVVTKDAINKK